MPTRFENTRTPEKKPVSKQLLRCAAILLLGVTLGVVQKYLDISQSELPPFLLIIDKFLDLHNFLGGFSPWIVLAVCISIYSSAPVWAGASVFSFFTGMISSYYLYSNYVGGFFPKNYAMVWIALTMISPFLAYLCWYAKGNSWFAMLISSGILGFLVNTAFAYGLWYLDLRSTLDLLMLLLAIAMLHKHRTGTLLEIGLSIPLAILMNQLIPFGIWD